MANTATEESASQLDQSAPEAPPPAYVSPVDPRHIEVYKQVILPATDKSVGVSMRIAAERIHEHAPTMLASLTGRKVFRPG